MPAFYILSRFPFSRSVDIYETNFKKVINDIIAKTSMRGSSIEN